MVAEPMKALEKSLPLWWLKKRFIINGDMNLLDTVSPALAMPPNWSAIKPASIIGYADEMGDHDLTLLTDHGPLSFDFFETGPRLLGGETPHNDYGLLVSLPKRLEHSLEDESDHLLVKTQNYQLKIFKHPFSFKLYNDEGKCVLRTARDAHFIRDFRLPPLAHLEDGNWFMAFDLDPYHPVYGLGEKWGRLDKRGQIKRSYNHDALGVNGELSYKNTPFSWSTIGYGLFVHTPYAVTHGIGFAPWSHRSYGLHVEGPHLDLFMFCPSGKGDNLGATILKDYSDLTGHASIPPDWSLGLILSRAYYKTADEILAAAHKVREKAMPCDVITFDGRAWQDTETRFCFEWDEKRYPNPRLVIEQLKAMNFRICVWEYPLVSTKNKHYQMLADKGYFLKNQKGEPYLYEWDREPFGPVLTPLPDSSIIDFTNPDAYQFWKQAHQPLFDMGVDMIKPDFGEQITHDMVAHNGATGEELHNIYSFLYNKCVHEAAQSYGKDGGFLFSRSGWTGSQRFPSLWGGDPQADWGGLEASIRGALSWGMSGGPFYATDVGGFYGDKRDPILYVRWLQAAVFSAHLRLHGIGEREPWSYGPLAEDAANQAIELRYRLLPYIKVAMQQSVKTGLPVMRSMALSFPKEPQCWAFDLQYCFGKDMLFVPCTCPNGHIEYYLPEGDWVRFDTKDVIAGGRYYEETLKLDQIALFIRKGATIPVSRAAPYIEDLIIADKYLKF